MMWINPRLVHKCCFDSHTEKERESTSKSNLIHSIYNIRILACGDNNNVLVTFLLLSSNGGYLVDMESGSYEYFFVVPSYRIGSINRFVWSYIAINRQLKRVSKYLIYGWRISCLKIMKNSLLCPHGFVYTLYNVYEKRDCLRTQRRLNSSGISLRLNSTWINICPRMHIVYTESVLQTHSIQ